jgi:hypothetical protein
MTTNTVSRTKSWVRAASLGLVLLGCGRADLASRQAIGRPCELGASASPAQGVYNTGAGECPSGLCFKPTTQPGATAAETTGPSCTGECTQDSDCAGELRDPTDPLDTRCARGFTCAIPFEVGPLCCKKLCLCRDFLGPQGAPTPIACQGAAAASCAGTAGAANPGTSGAVEVVTSTYMSLAPMPQLDLVTVVDNSPTMGPKIAKLNAGFPKLVEALKNPVDGALPDLRIAILDSDLGTGGQYTSGPCGPKLLSDGTSSVFGDLGRFQMRAAPASCAFNAGSLFLEYKAGAPANYSGDIGSVFSCLTGNLGTAGCFETHQLQTLEFGLAAHGIGNELQQSAFLRPTAQLGLLLLSDSDDCSAALNPGMFGDKNELRGESPRLRCATRGHLCAGMNLADSLPGYPASAAFEHPFWDCMARMGDACPDGTDTSVGTACSPLRDIRTLAWEILALKSDPSQILVAGIFGWPRTAADLATATYKIAPVPNPSTADPAHPVIFDSWPVCYDPNHPPAAATIDPATGFDATAAAWGATGGLRESAFIDQFGGNGLKFSACEPDFGPPLAAIGKALWSKLENLCFDYKLVDVDPVTPGVQTDCRVTFLTPVVGVGGIVTYLEEPLSIPYCPAGVTSETATGDCWQIVADPVLCPISGQRVSVVRTAEEIRASPQLPAGMKLRLACETCPAAAPGVPVVPGCAS